MNFLYLIWYNITYYWNWLNSMNVKTVGIVPVLLVGCVVCIAPLVIGIIKRRYFIAVLTCLACILTFVLVPMANVLTPIWVGLVLSLVQLAFAKKEKSEIDLSEL